MMRARALLATVLCMGMSAAAEQDAKPVFACNLKAISAAQRPRYNELVKRIRAAIRGVREIGNGYVFRLDGKAASLTEAAEWIAMERLCCPFLTLQLSAAGHQADWSLTITGPEGVKEMIVQEFAAP